MAAKHCYRQGFLLLLFHFISAAALDKRFSDFKRCADAECSMLLCRGKAIKDFSGPDCRFLSFKESETIYVYYKLSGIREDMWAGSVGSKFGYFPKDLLALNHLYTEKELEVPAEETDFVCFDTGFDKFDNYNVDLLLGSLVQENDSENTGTSEQIQVSEETKETPAPPPPSSSSSSSESENPAELDVSVDPSSSLPKLDLTTEPPPTKVVEPDTADSITDTIIQTAEERENTVETIENVSESSKTKDTPIKTEVESVPEDVKKRETESVSLSEGVKIPELKTAFGTTFDAVTTDEEITTNVTPYEEEESKDVESHPEGNVKVTEETPLLPFSEQVVNTPEAFPFSEGVKIPELKTTFGTTFDAVTTDEEITTNVTPYKEEESKDVESHQGDDVDVAEETPLLSFSEEVVNIPEAVSFSEGVKIPELKTTFGTTFDAVTTDEEITTNVTPYEEEESKDVESHPEDNVDVAEETPLLSFSEESVNSPESDTIKVQEIPPVTPNDQAKAAAERNIWTSIGDAVFSAVTGVETTAHDVSSDDEDDDDDEEEDEEDDEEEAAIATPLSNIEELKKDVEQPLNTEPPKEPENMDQVQQDPAEPIDDTDTVTNYEEQFHEDESEGELSEHEDNLDETLKPVDEISESNNQTELNVLALDSLSKDHILSNTEVDSKITHEDKEEEEAPNDLEIGSDIASKQHSSVATDHRKEMNKAQDEDKMATDEAITETKKDQYHEKLQLHDFIKDEEKMDDAGLPDKIHDSLVKDEEKVDAGLSIQIPDSLVKDLDNEVNASSSEAHAEQPDQMHNTLVEHEKKTVDASSSLHTHDSSVKDVKDVLDSSLPGEFDDSLAEDVEKEDNVNPSDHIYDSSKTNLELENIQHETFIDEPEIHDEMYTEGREDENGTELEQDKDGENEELLEDENALLFSQSDNTELDKPSPETDSESAPEPEYSNSVMRLTLLRDHFTEQQVHRFQKLLGLQNLFKVEAMFSDLDTELQSYTDDTHGIENALESILESSENTILDEIEKMLDSRETVPNYDHQGDTNDEETEILEEFQELTFSLRQKYSTVSDSTPLATEQASDIAQDKHEVNVEEDVSHVVEEDNPAKIPEIENNTEDNLTVIAHEGRPLYTEDEQMLLDKVHTGPDISVEEDGGHFNKNKDNQPSFSESDELQKVPQATLENPLDLGLGVEVENSPSGSLDSMEPVSEIHEEEVGAFTTGLTVISGFLWMCKSKIEEWTIVMISLLPEEWKPGETLYGCPWQAVVITALVGVVTFTLFFCRTVLAVKKREYLVDERKLTEQIQALKKEKNDVLEKMTQLQKQTEQLKENRKHSKEAVSCTIKKMEDLESKVLEAETQNQRMVEEQNTYIKLLEEERANSLQNQTRIEKLEKTNEKLQLSRKRIQEALAKTTVLLDEAKIREDARNAHQKSLDKDYAALKEENKTLKVTIKNWEDKHMALSEQIKVYHKSQKDLEDSLVLKDHNVEVLSELLADLDACDLQKGDTKVLANGEVAPDKKTVIKNRIKRMMDVSRVQTTLTVVEEERDRFMSKLLDEEKARKTLEEQHQELEHAIATLKSEKSHVDNQLKILQQKNEIMVEMYQQKENALQQRLTKEELERRSKENLLSEVGGKAVEAEEQVKVLRQRINEMEEQMKKTEEVYKEQIKEQENKTHSNWVNARNAERALNQEKLEASKLREKLAVLTSQLNERRAPLFRPNSGQPSGPRQGDSYAPSPVSGGAPSPPLMIEGPRRPPSAPVGRRIDPYGPRPPSDPHNRYAENKHISGMDMMGPRSSSPANMDVSTQAVNPQIKAETLAEASTESPEPASTEGPGSFLASPIRDSPGPMVQGPGPGPHDPLLPPGRLPPPGLYRPPRPGLYHLPPGPHGPHGPGPNVLPPLHGPPLPANGQPGMPLPGPMAGDFGPRPANGHSFPPRPGPGPIMDPRGPLPPHFRPPLPMHLGPIPPPTGIRGPIGPRQPIPPDMRFPGPHQHTSPPMDMPPGVLPHPSNAFGQVPPNPLHNSVGGHTGPGQDLHTKQEAPQDSAKPAMVKP